MTAAPRRSVVLSPAAAGLLRAAAQLLPKPSYLVGGALRDALLGRPTPDLDLSLRGSRAAAAVLARRLRATLVVLDETTGTYRLVLADKSGPIRHIDLSELQGQDISEDLQRRDFTVNALALPLDEELAQTVPIEKIIDPRAGLADLDRGLLRCESEDILKQDPLRLLRAFRLGAQLGLGIEQRTLRLMQRLRQRVRQPAAERIGAELTMMLSLPGCSLWVGLMEATGILTALLEDLEPMRQCAQCYYGKAGVLGHTLAVVERLDFLLENLERAFPQAAAPLCQSLGPRLQPGHGWRATLMLAALLHDVSKPETARRMGGRLRFFGHDATGAKRAAAMLKALRFPNDTIETVAAVVAHHLRPGNLAAGGALSDKAVYRFFRDLGEEAVALLLVCWADHASYLPQRQIERLLPAASADPDAFDDTQVRPPEARKTLHHLQVIALLLRRRFDSQRRPVPERILSGHDVMKILEIKPGPQVGATLERLREAQAEGRVATRRQAVDFIRRLKKQKCRS
ncbi:MAG TPA: hypothetical protein DCP85_12345 [Elusimicrobia bacterium]|nr:hypothetical protein [Elusimicrobiota bacterium]